LENKTYIIAAGGTSGHINPAIAIADKIRKREPDSHIVSAERPRDSKTPLSPNHHYELVQSTRWGFPINRRKQFFQAVAAFFPRPAAEPRPPAPLEPGCGPSGQGDMSADRWCRWQAAWNSPPFLHEQERFSGEGEPVSGETGDRGLHQFSEIRRMRFQRRTGL